VIDLPGWIWAFEPLLEVFACRRMLQEEEDMDGGDATSGVNLMG